jgi:hypothetical protein
MSIAIHGKIVNGWGAAADALGKQLPEFRERHPELDDCYEATLNVELEHALQVDNPDFDHGPAKKWNAKETYKFVRVSLELPLGSSGRRAWIYIASLSPHLRKIFQVELITSKIDDTAVTIGTPCCIHIHKPHTTRTLIII